ncbi:radical SAM protein [Pseudodesulfovibrio sp. F-1]|uniref:FeMo cofactor biosynthesis protein NifB n=1 Tax=Pseudodesulfovibrio alkaliphilus TaxID=2661613 RepID=A0A7K1KPJ8_9BACT|nr:radical SAM protein [Pseudodesulfovibrio alkaliphilus]MUM77997.1 radical SAM protein [Pseudodesulfovibrio alkaliphilus]
MAVKDITRHPCFNKETAGSCGRVHLPVAPRCNIQCNYCNRKYDCVNESRPGVTSGVLKPFQAAEYMDKVLAREPRITVAGIAGPGDPFANPAEVMETMRLLNERHPHLLFCLSTNGMGILPYLDDIAALGVSHVTITISAVDPVVGARIYAWVKDGNVVYRGERGAALLLERQLAAIRGLKERGIVVKINSIIIPGVNEDHLPEVARMVAGLGADIQNMIPLKPAQDTPFAGLGEPGPEVVLPLRRAAGGFINQMTHCKRCRADAVGLLGDDQSGALCGTLQACAKLKSLKEVLARPYVAVASREGMLVNQHLGEAGAFQIWGQGEGGYRLVEERQAPPAGCGPQRWADLAALLGDCRAVLAAAMGETPRMLLEEHGVSPHVVTGLIEDALRAIYETGDLKVLKGRRGGIAGGCCTGTGASCG